MSLSKVCPEAQELQKLTFYQIGLYQIIFNLGTRYSQKLVVYHSRRHYEICWSAMVAMVIQNGCRGNLDLELMMQTKLMHVHNHLRKNKTYFFGTDAD
jgi:hypothetical protein